MSSSGRQIFVNPELHSKRKRHATPFGAGYTEYQPGMDFLELLRAQSILAEPRVKLQKTKVLLN